MNKDAKYVQFVYWSFSNAIAEAYRLVKLPLSYLRDFISWRCYVLETSRLETSRLGDVTSWRHHVLETSWRHHVLKTSRLGDVMCLHSC